jgi:threonine synthase
MAATPQRPAALVTAASDITMARVINLRCKECERTYPVSPQHVCEFCFGPLEPAYDYDEIASIVTRERIANGPPTVWRYADMLPVADGVPRIDRGAGFTPLLRAERLGAELGIRNLYIKNDTANPTHSFKDRVVTIALTVARSMGFDTVACASTGNLANAVAAHAAVSGLRAFVFIPADLEAAKIVTTGIYGANIVAVKGNYDEVNRLCSEVAQKFPWAFVNVNIRAFYSEGSKTVAFEITEQMGWSPPDHVVAPVASGSLLTKVHRGLQELERVGLIDEVGTRIHAAQAAGCSPVVEAIEAGREHVKPVKPHTIAKSLAIGNPADGYYAVKAVKASGGSAAAVSDEELVEGIQLLARTEGIFTETAGGVTTAALAKLAAAGKFAGDESVVALITGMGLKTADVVSGLIRPQLEVRPDLESFEEELQLLSDNPEEGGSGGVAAPDRDQLRRASKLRSPRDKKEDAG